MTSRKRLVKDIQDIKTEYENSNYETITKNELVTILTYISLIIKKGMEKEELSLSELIIDIRERIMLYEDSDDDVISKEVYLNALKYIDNELVEFKEKM